MDGVFILLILKWVVGSYLVIMGRADCLPMIVEVLGTHVINLIVFFVMIMAGRVYRCFVPSFEMLQAFYILLQRLFSHLLETINTIH